MASPNSRAKELQAAGQALYRIGNYNEALSKFSEALSVTTAAALQVGILDNRAAAHEKLGKDHYRAALKDARKMMGLQKTSVKGYLRAGKILQLMRELGVALETYKYGLKQIDDGDIEGKRLLEGMHQKVVIRLEAAKAPKVIDPLRALPFELVDMIFKYLPFEALMLLQRVCRGWRQFLLAYSRSYTTLDFSAAKKPVSKFTIKTYLKRAPSAVTKAVLLKTDHDTMAEVSGRCKQLSELIVRSTTGLISGSIVSAVKLAANLTILELSCETTSSAVVDIIKYSKKLDSLQCHRIVPSDRFDWDGREIRGLKKLALMWYSADDYYPPYVYSNFDRMLEFLPELRELELVRSQLGMFPMPPDVSELSHLEVLVIRGTDIWVFPKVPESLRRLDVSENPSLKYRPGRDFIPSGLESFSISANPRIGNDELLSILEATSKTKTLRYLDLGMCPRIDADSLGWLLDPGYGEKLEFLSLEGNPSFGDQVTKELGRMMSLKRLNISNTKISGVGICNLIHRKNSRLQWLGLDYCKNIGRDALDVVLAEGIELSHRIEQLKGGRKVRY